MATTTLSAASHASPNLYECLGSTGADTAEIRGVESVQINISARHGQLADGTRERIEGKVEKLARFFERLTSIQVTVDLEREQSPLVELIVSAEHKHDFVASDRSENLMTSVESVVHKVEQQIKKYKEKLQGHRGPGIGQMAAEGQPETE